MKKPIIFIIALSISICSFAQVPFYDDFDGPNYGWWTHNASQWEYGIPVNTTINFANTGINVWGIDLDSSYLPNLTSYLYSPQFDVTGIDTVILSFHHWVNLDSNNNYDRASIQYKSNSSPNWVILGYIGDPMANNWYNVNFLGTHGWHFQNSGWMESSYKLNLSYLNAINGDSIQFRFEFYSDGVNNTQDGWAIDDFSLSLLPSQNDYGVIKINSPDTNNINFPSDTVRVTIMNFGTKAITSLPVCYQLNGGPIIMERWTGFLASNDTAVYTFNTLLNFPSSTVQLCAFTDSIADIIAINNEVCSPSYTIPNYVNVGIKIVYPIDTTSLSWNPPVWLQIYNYGTDTIFSLPLKYEVNSATVNDVFNDTLLPNDSVIFKFQQTYVSPLGVYSLCAQSLLQTDMYPFNDLHCKYLYQGNINNPFININAIKTIQDIELFPNPTSGLVSIEYKLLSNKEITFQIHNSYGQLIHSETIHKNAGNHILKINLSSEASGMYYYSFEVDGKRIVKKIMIQ